MKERRGFRHGLLILFLLFLCFGAAVYLISVFFGRSDGFTLADEVAVVEVKGVLLDSRDILDDLDRYAKDGHVKAIVLRIDSPGGGVAPSQEIYRQVFKIRDGENGRDGKKVVASMGSIAASGGYYVACAADRVFANAGTLTGSIGVIMEVGNYEELLGKLGLKQSVIKSGKYKDILSPTREITPEEKALVQGLVDNVFQQFVSAIADGRKMERARVEAVADGRILSGEQALEAGLVDSIGGLGDAIAEAGRLAGIEGEPKVLYRKPKVGLLDFLLQESRFQGILNRPGISWPGLFYLTQAPLI